MRWVVSDACCCALLPIPGQYAVWIVNGTNSFGLAVAGKKGSTIHGPGTMNRTLPKGGSIGGLLSLGLMVQPFFVHCNENLI